MIEIKLPWGAWYRDTLHSLGLPDHWSVDVLSPGHASPLTAEQIGRAVSRPIGGPSLGELARGVGSACIVVDDLARPTRAGDVLPNLTGELHEAGLAADDIRIVVGTGSHGALDRPQLEWKLGPETVARYHVECHCCRSGLVGTGISYGGRELSVNRTFYEAELRIAVGGVLPHSFAGYSGGAKLVLPGLCDLPATARSHKFVQLGFRGGADPNENRFRLESEKIVRRLGLGFVVCVLTNGWRETVGVCAGDMVAAHRRACRAAGEIFRTGSDPPYDALILNAYPKDIDLIQTENVFVALKTAGPLPLRENGVILLTAAASEGVGRHGLFGPKRARSRRRRSNRALSGGDLWVYVPQLSTQDVQAVYWDGCQVFQERTALYYALNRRFGAGPCRAAVLPCAPMQQLTSVRSISWNERL